MTPLGNRIGRGIGWSAADQTAQEVLRFVSLLVLARLLSPADFGLVALLGVAAGLIGIVAEFSIGAAIVRRANPDYLDSAFWLNLTLGVVASGFLWMGAVPLAEYYGAPMLGKLARITALTFPVSALGAIHAGLLVRRMDFRALAIRNGLGQAAGLAIACLLAWKGYGASSIVLGNLAGAAVTTAIVWKAEPWRPSLRVRAHCLRELVGFSGRLTGSALIGFWSRNFDQFLIGSLEGEAALGYYSRAYSLFLGPIRKIAGRVDAVLFPAFASIRDDSAAIAALYLKASRLVSAITFPISFGLCAAAPEAIAVLFGPKWDGMVPFLRILAPLGAIQSVLSMGGAIYLAKGRADLSLRVTTHFTLGTSLAVTIGVLQGGSIGVAFGYAVFSLLAAPFIYLAAARLVGLCLSAQIRNLSAIAAISAAMLIVVLSGSFLLPPTLPPILRLMILVGAGACFYFLCFLLFRPRVFAEYRELVGILKQRISSGNRPSLGRSAT
jgi:PST family polysaccharide transporter